VSDDCEPLDCGNLDVHLEHSWESVDGDMEQCPGREDEIPCDPGCLKYPQHHRRTDDPCPALPDPINSPSHYTWLGGIEVIDITEHLGFCLGNVVKYVCRADHKGKPIEDLEKAQWYLAREIARRKR
jgi:hypothetical protein